MSKDLRSKIADRLSEEDAGLLREFIKARESGNQDLKNSIADKMSEEGAGLAQLFIRSLDREKDIIKLELEASPVLSRAKAYGEGVAGVLPFGQELGTAIRAGLDPDKDYYQQKSEDEQLREVLKEQYPGAFYTGAGVGVGTQLLAPFGVAGKTVTKAGTLGKTGQAAQKVAAGPVNIFGKSAVGRAASVPTVGAIYGATANPEGVTNIDDELKSRLSGAAQGALLSSVLPAGAAILKGGQKVAGSTLRGIPGSVTEAIYENPNVLNTTKKSEQVAQELIDMVATKGKAIGEDIDKVLTDATSSGARVDLSETVKIIDDEIARLKNLAVQSGDEASQDLLNQVAELTSLKNKYFAPAVKKSLTMYPDQDLVGQKKVTKYDTVVSRPYDPDKAMHVEVKTKVPYEQVVSEQLNVPPQNVYQEFQPGPYSSVSPNYSQDIKRSIVDEFGLFKKKQQPLLEQVAGSIGSAQRKAVSGIGGVLPEERIVELPAGSGKPFDLWGKLQTEKANVSKSLFGTVEFPRVLTDDKIAKVVEKLATDDGSVAATLSKVLPPDDVAKFVKYAQEAYAGEIFQKGSPAVKQYFKNRGLWATLNAGLKTIAGGFGVGGLAATGMYGGPGSLAMLLGGLGAGAALSSKKAYQAIPKVYKGLKTAARPTVSTFLGVKGLKSNEEQ